MKLALSLSFVGLMALVIYDNLGAQSTARWVSKQCITSGCVADVLNNLSAERAAEAKLTTWRDLTYVWYRQ